MKKKKFIPNIRKRLEEGLLINTHVTQILTKHGDITVYLYEKAKRRPTAVCQRCMSDEVEDAIHVIMDCISENPQEAKEHLKTELQIQGELDQCPLPDLFRKGVGPF